MSTNDRRSPTGEWFLYPWEDGTMRAYWVPQRDRLDNSIPGEIRCMEVNAKAVRAMRRKQSRAALRGDA